MELNKIIKEERQKQRMSLRELGKKSNVNFPTIFNIENGGDCKISTLEKILNALKIEICVKNTPKK